MSRFRFLRDNERPRRRFDGRHLDGRRTHTLYNGGQTAHNQRGIWPNYFVEPQLLAGTALANGPDAYNAGSVPFDRILPLNK